MYFLKVATFLLVVLAVGAEKKIELQDIEEDNLRSEMKNEKEKEHDKSDSPQSTGSESGPGYNPLDFWKNGLLKYFDNPSQIPQQQQRYVHQYAVTEQPEKPAPVLGKAQYGLPAAQHAMVGYLSNMPMQIYLVPQYYSEQSEQSNHQHAQYQLPSGHAGVPRVAEYPTAPEAVQTQTNYIEAPPFKSPKAKAQHYIPHQAVTYVTYPAHPTAPAPQATIAPVLALPVLQYNSAVVPPSSVPKVYYQNPEYSDINSVDEVSQNTEYSDASSVEPKQYSSHSTAPYQQLLMEEFPRHYNSRTPIREEYRHHAIPELPHPNPLLLKASPSHLAHIPKSLPMYRPLSKPVYQGGLIPSSFTPRPHDRYGPPLFNRRPSSLIDSYIPSSLQVEYLKRGLVKEPLAAYDALASGRLHHPSPRHYERGFLPNQMHHTAAGGVTYGHYKRTPKVDKIPQK